MRASGFHHTNRANMLRNRNNIATPSDRGDRPETGRRTRRWESGTLVPRAFNRPLLREAESTSLRPSWLEGWSLMRLAV